MFIVVVGPGAVGCLFAALLDRSGHHVILLDHDARRAAKLAQSGVRVDTGGASDLRQVPVTADSHAIDRADALIICVKAYDTADAARSVAPVVQPHTLVVSLQNGIGNGAILDAELPQAGGIACAVTYTGATTLEPGHVRQVGPAAASLAPYAGDGAAGSCRQLASLMHDAGIHVRQSDNVASLTWSKAVINAGINPVTALAGIPNGAILDSPEHRHTLEAAVGEAGDVAAAAGITLLFDNACEEAQRNCKATAGNISSMLADRRAGRRTEIEAINGQIVQKADALGVAVPTNRRLLRAVRQAERGSAWSPMQPRELV